MSLGRLAALNPSTTLGDLPRLLEIDPLSDDRWRQLVNSSPYASLFHSPRWLDVLRQTYGFTIRATVAEEADGTLRAGVVHAVISDVRGRRLVSLPFSDFCDPLVGDEIAWSRLSDALIRDRIPLSFRFVHNTVGMNDDRFEIYKDARWHGVDLTRSPEAMWEAIDSGSRRAIRKARSQGVRVERAETKPELREFYSLHGAIRTRKYNMLAQPYSFFEAIWDRFLARGDGFLLLARHEGRVVAGVLYLRFGDTIYYKFNASDQSELQVRPNDLLAWEGMIRAKSDLACRRLDFGLSDSDQPGLIRYKRKFATEEKTIYFMRRQPDSWVQRETEQKWSSILPELTKILTDGSVPPAVSEQASNVLYRFFA